MIVHLDAAIAFPFAIYVHDPCPEHVSAEAEGQVLIGAAQRFVSNEQKLYKQSLPLAQGALISPTVEERGKQGVFASPATPLCPGRHAEHVLGVFEQSPLRRDAQKSLFAPEQFTEFILVATTLIVDTIASVFCTADAERSASERMER